MDFRIVAWAISLTVFAACWRQKPNTGACSLSREFSLLSLTLGYRFATLISLGPVLQAEITYRRYNSWRDVVIRLIIFCVCRHFVRSQFHIALASAGSVAVLEWRRAVATPEIPGFLLPAASQLAAPTCNTIWPSRDVTRAINNGPARLDCHDYIPDALSATICYLSAPHGQ